MTTTPNPTTTNTNRPYSGAVTTTPPRGSYPIHYNHPHQLYQTRPTPQTQIPNPNSGHGIPYPVASSGRGFIPRPLRPSPDHALPNLAYHPRASFYRPPFGSGSLPLLDQGSGHHPPLLNRQHPSHLQHLHHHQQQLQQHYTGGISLGAAPAPAPAPINGIPVTGLPTKVAPSPASDSNGHKNMRDRSRDDSVVTVKDRKVRISDGASLYSLCRSWLRNGFPEESQPYCGDGVKSLPRPLPPVVDTHSPKKEEGDDVAEEAEENEESVAHLSTEDLLKRHINRAKRVRARLREGRLKRIARYKTRLALLLPPHVEQFRNDTVAGN